MPMTPHSDQSSTALPNEGPRVRILSRTTQVRLLAGAAGVAVLAIGIGLSGAALSKYLIRGDEGAPVPAAPGVFRPTAEQMRNLTIAPVEVRPFHSEEITEGIIAVDDDLATPVFSPFSGRVSRLSAKLGDVVAKGAPLMMVETPEIIQAQNDAVAAGGAADAAAAQLGVATRSAERAHALYDIKGLALKDLQQADADLAAARVTARSTAAARDAARNRLRIYGWKDREIAALLAGEGGGGAQAVVSAPIAGTVIQRQVGLGQFIQAGSSTPVFSVGDLSKVWMVANVREDAAARVRVGQSVEVRVSAYPARVFRARLTSVGPIVDPVQHRLPVRAEIDNADGALAPQMFASFAIATSAETTAPAVPVAAVITEGAETRVWVVNHDSTLALRPIRTGRMAGDAGARVVEVTEGLAEGERVVVAGALFIDRAAQAG